MRLNKGFQPQFKKAVLSSTMNLFIFVRCKGDIIPFKFVSFEINKLFITCTEPFTSKRFKIATRKCVGFDFRCSRSGFTSWIYSFYTCLTGKPQG